jgi:hypothetical protein
MLAVLIVRHDATAEASFAAIRARSKFGIAIAAMIKMIATTIKSSISEKPFWFLRIFIFLRQRFLDVLERREGWSPGTRAARKAVSIALQRHAQAR